MNSDEELIARYRNGEASAFEELFGRYCQPVFGFFRRRVEDRSRAEELTQDTFVALLRGSARFEARSSFRTYLFGIAMNLLHAERRGSRREPVGETAAEPAVSSEPETALWVRAAIAELDDMDREVLLLREYEELSYAEIGQLLKIPVNTVRSRLFRARMAMRELLLGRDTVARSSGE